MAEDNDIPQEIKDALEDKPETYLPYDTEFLNSACYALEILQGVDGKLYSRTEESRLETSKRRLLQIVHASVKAIHQDYFQREDDGED